MASFSYAGLSVRVSADTRPLTASIARDATRAGQQAGDALAKNVTQSASRAGTQAGQAIARGLGTVRDTAVRVASAIPQAFGRAWSAVSSAAGRAASAASSAWARVADAASPVTSAMSRAFSAVTTAAGRAASAAGAAFSRAFGPAGAAVSTALGRAFAAVQGAAGRAASAAGSVFSRALGPAGAAVTNSLGRAFAAVQGAAGRAASAAGTVWSRAVAPAGAAVTNSLGRAFSSASSAAGRSAAAAGSAFARAAGSAGNAITTGLGRAFAAVQSAAGRAGSAISGMLSGAGTGGAGGGGGMLSGLLSTVKALPMPIKAAGAAMGLLGGGVIAAGVSYNTLSQTSRAAFTTILGSSKAADEMMGKITAFAKSSPFPRQAFIEGAQQMVSFGVSAEKVIPYFTSIQDAVAATGGSAQTLSEITLVMSQIQAAGKITGVDLMQFAQRGINAADLIGKAMGKSGQQIKDEITAGTLDSTKALDALSKGMEKTYGGAAENVKNTWAGTTDRIKGAMRDVMSAIITPFIDPKGGGLAINWGNDLATALRGAIPTITRIATLFGQGIALAARILATLVGWAVKFNGWLVPIAGGIMAIVVAVKIYNTAIAVVQLATRAWAAVQALLNVVMAANPIAIVVLAIIGLAVAIAIAWQRSATFRNVVIAAWNAIRAVVMPVIAVLISGIAPLVAAWNWARSVMSAAWSAIVAGVGWVVGFVRANWPLLLGVITGPIGMAVVLIIRYWTQIQAVFAAAWGFIRSVTAAALGWITSAMAATWNWARSATAAVWNAIRSLVVGTWNAIRGALAAGLTWFRSALAGTWNWARSATAAVWGAIRSIVVGMWNAIRGALAAGFGWFRSALAGTWNWARSATAAVWSGIRGIITGTWNAIRGFLAAGFGWFRSALAGTWNWARSATASIWNGIRALITAVWNAVKSVTGAALGWLRSALAGTWNWARSATASIWNGIRAVIAGAWNGIKSATGAALGWLRSTMASVWGQIRSAAVNAWNGIVNGIRGAWDRIKNVIAGPARWVVSNVVNKLINGINTLITKIGIPKISPIAGFAEGGRVPGGYGGGDRQLILAEPGEWVLTKQQARGIGYRTLRGLPRYQHGGEVGGVPQARFPGLDTIKSFGGAFARITHMDDLAKAGAELFDEFSGMLTFAASEAFRVLTTPLKKAVEPWVKDPQVFPKQWLGKTVVNIIDKAIEFIASKSMGECDAGGIVAHALQFEGKPYRWGGGANPSTGFDCSSFVNFIAGSAGLPLPGGFKVPSPSHGPATTQWLSFTGMDKVPYPKTAAGDVAVNSHHMGFIIGGGGSGFAARSTATGIGKQSFASGYTYLRWKGGSEGASGGCEGGGGQGPPGSFPSGVRNYASIVARFARQLGVPQATNAFLSQMQSESNGNPRAVNNWDSNARAGTPSKGLMQVIQPTFDAYAGPYRNRGIWDPMANIFAAMNYAVRRYGGRLLSVIGHGHGYARGGILREHVIGIGQQSGEVYHLAENGRPEVVTPMSDIDRAARQLGTGGGRSVTVNVYPREHQDERAIAAAVSRELAWSGGG
jgi:tape measure domain-containing protein